MGENDMDINISAIHPEDEGSMDIRNVGILPQHYTASQSRRRLETCFDVLSIAC
jgi:hypothetical protein